MSKIAPIAIDSIGNIKIEKVQVYDNTTNGLIDGVDITYNEQVITLPISKLPSLLFLLDVEMYEELKAYDD